jgi:predicted Zn-dependent protease
MGEFHMLNWRQRAPLAVVLWIALFPAASARGQDNAPVIPMFDPQNFVPNFLGPTSDEDRQRLREIEVPLAQERKAGAAAAEQFLRELNRQGVKVAERGKNVEYLQRLVVVLQPHMRNAARYRQIKVYVADAPRIDARSFPGGSLIFFQGLLDFAESEAAVAGVVGHELSHLDRGHQLLALKQTKLAQETFSGQQGFSPQQFMQSASLLMQTFAKPFRPEDEADADRDGATWAYHAGYDPREMARLLLAMHEREGDADGRRMPLFLRTHPFHRDRVAAIYRAYEDLQKAHPRAGLYIGRENLKRRITRAEREFAE